MMSLERLLDGLDVAIEPLVVYDLRREWSPSAGRIGAPTVHCTLSGSVILELVGGATVHCSTRRVVVLPPPQRPMVSEPGPRGTARARAGGGRLPAEPTRIGAGAADPDVLVACGRIRASYQRSVGLFDHLREPLVEDLAAGDPIRRAFEELRDDFAAQRPGSRAMVEAILRRCFILLLRRCCRPDQRRPAWLVVFEDAGLGRAVAAMQDRPERSFTLPGLAEVAGMSRSVFAARFADALGQSPIEFLTTLRLTRAAHLLARTDLPVKTVAAWVGYSSRSSFTRAFVARHGVGPTAFRAAAGGSEAGRGAAGREQAGAGTLGAGTIFDRWRLP